MLARGEVARRRSAAELRPVALESYVARLYWTIRILRVRQARRVLNASVCIGSYKRVFNGCASLNRQASQT